MHAHQHRPAPAPAVSPARSGQHTSPHLRQQAGNRAAVQASRKRGTPVQRVLTHDELHRHPDGPSLVLHGPRAAIPATGADKNQVQDPELWRELRATHRHTYQRPWFKRILPDRRQRLAINDSPDELRENHRNPRGMPLVYTVGGAQSRIAPRPQGTYGQSRADDFEFLGRRDATTLPYWQRQDERVETLAAHSVDRSGQFQANGGAAAAAAKQTQTQNTLAATNTALAGATQLLNTENGIAIGGAHATTQVWDFLVDNLAALRAQGVRTVYLESIKEDSTQRAVDEFLRSGRMNPVLDTFLTNYQANFAQVGSGLRRFLIAAQREGIRVKGIDSRPARPQGLRGDDAQHARATLMNTYAAEVVEHDRAGQTDPGKYLMEIGAAHGRTHHASNPQQPPQVAGSTLPAQFPGVNELLDIPAVELFTAPGGPQTMRELQ
ncbi:hypothetical protein [Winogradskya humida]|uniref:Zeta toxin n=1 Tax=Winogradskya humida TaxID=113566 RepID=A0ABQ3ZP32_9ACTN|nr:hypothetical protein [Actinoplanes humidus]GIE20321.1 hypothetical protein Ahu01nite_034230 [Actinoplanes humidus]